ncbi:Scd6-like Sm domain-containing protein [Zopfochytrium polystomum]|nr:Scd6-like Sm domain-containing protein [Zopfochytrium polystomum]
MAFVGSTISLISKSDIRYVGILHSINQQESTVALQNVRSFGTEGRRTSPAESIPASQHVFEYIVFRGSDIKDLQVVNAPPAPQIPQLPNDPAILQARGGAPQGGSWNIPSNLGGPTASSGWGNPTTVPAPAQTFSEAITQAGGSPQRQQQRNLSYEKEKPDALASKMESLSLNQRTQPPKTATAEAKPTATLLAARPPRKPDTDSAADSSTKIGTGRPEAQGQGQRRPQRQYHSAYYEQSGDRAVTRGGYRGGGGRVGGRGGRVGRPITVPNSDYDFESANAKFDKAAAALEPTENAPGADEPVEFYNKKKSFFDDISCEAKDRATGERRNLRPHEERKLNIETFGQPSIDGFRSGPGYSTGNRRGGRGFNHSYGARSQRVV